MRLALISITLLDDVGFQLSLFDHAESLINQLRMYLLYQIAYDIDVKIL